MSPQKGAEGIFSDLQQEGSPTGCPQGSGRVSRRGAGAAAPRKGPRTPQHAVPAAAAADPEVRAPPPRSPLPAHPRAAGRAGGGPAWPELRAARDPLRGAAPLRLPGAGCSQRSLSPGPRDAGAGPGRGPRAEAWPARRGPRRGPRRPAQGVGPRARARPSRRRGGGGGGRGREGESGRLGARGGRAREGAAGSPPPPEGGVWLPLAASDARRGGRRSSPRPARLPAGAGPCLPPCALLAAAAAEEEPGAR